MSHYRRATFGVTPKKRKSLSEKYPELDQQFKMNPNPTKAEVLNLVEATGLTRRQIYEHFYNRRRRNT